MAVCHHSDTDRVAVCSAIESDKDPSYMDPEKITIAPCKEFLFAFPNLLTVYFKTKWQKVTR